MPHIHEEIDFTVVVYIIHQGKVLLIYHKELQKWLPIGGHIELNEDPEQAVYREAKEESGLEVEVYGRKPPFNSDTFQSLLPPIYLDIHRINAKHRHLGMVYFARVKSGDIRLNEEEHDAIQWFTMN